MEFPKKNFKKFTYSRMNIIGEITLKENGHEVDNLVFRSNTEFRTALNILKKYGFNNNEDFNKEVEEERKNLELIKQGYLNKD
jgi:predicted transcriptional regulator